MLKERPQEDFPVVAIGASAGGLEACRAMLGELPGDLHAALILILHLDPTHDSMMVDLLADHTHLDVIQASEGQELKPGCLYVIPPGVFLTVAKRTIHLTAPAGGKAVRLPFDALLKSLAEDLGPSAACIVLSGTGSDGTSGIADIHDAGGLVIVQDPKEAGYPGMPDSALATGKVSEVLGTDQMANAITRFADRIIGGAMPAKGQKVDPAPPKGAKPGYNDLIAFIGNHAEQDLLLYKRGTLERRIVRRMALVGLGADEIGGYLTMLKADAAERVRLSADLLIHVTSFFRDPAVFDHLSSKAIPELLKGLPAGRALRVWVAGCSTGEESYSIAMLCLEVMQDLGFNGQLQILASDIDPEAIAMARAGFYPKEIAAAVSPERLARFFVEEEGGWRVSTELRNVVVFTVADLLSDPPFSKIDLVSCRNVLIYLGPEAQKRVIARCCFALKPGGLLLLGAAEMPGASDGCFAVEDKSARLWRRVGKSSHADLNFTNGIRTDLTVPNEIAPVRRGALADLCRRIVIEQYAPAAVLMNARLEVLYLLGPTEKYLTITQGHPDPGFIGMLPKVLRARVRAAAAACTVDTSPVTVSGGRILGKNGFDIALHTVKAGAETMLLACFIDTPNPAPRTSDAEAAADEARHTGDLEADLEAARSDLSDALRDLEKEVEAHGADAAEALSVNEEFQSTNEELLASKEELQSLNEELTALNSQLQETLERHRTTANDLQNVLYSTDVATLFLDLNLKIRFFTPAARQIFRVISTDVGRPLSDLASVSRDDDLDADCRRLLTSSEPIEREIESAGERWLLRRAQPYRTEGGRVEGIVITYVDITERKHINADLVAAMTEADRATKAKSRFLAAASHDLRQPLQSMALLHNLLSGNKRSTEGARLAALMDLTLTSMTAMLDSMLDVNRIETGVVRPDMRPVAIGPLLERLAEEFRTACEIKGLKLKVAPCTAWVRTDPQLLVQMLRNLLSNALKYTPQGGILLGCRRRGADLMIVVCDTGVGVVASETGKIFDPYHQGENTTELAGNGLGLGLSIVKRLSELMDQPISVLSTPGKGSSFMIRAPMVEPGPTGTDEIQNAATLQDAIVQTGTILLVEDEEPLRGLLAEILEKGGHQVIALSNSKSAAEWASSAGTVPDLVLTDYDLHGSATGLKLAQDLPEILGTAVPTVILTGDITSDTLTRIAASSCHQVTKPVMPDVLLAKISNLIRTARAERGTSDPVPRSSRTSIHVIDDDPFVREVMRRLFEAEGYMVMTYASAEDFLAAPRPGNGACLLIDNLLPGMKGVALIDRLRSEKARLPTVMLTGHGDAALAVAAMKAGASDLIEKPASAADLLASVQHALATAKDGKDGKDGNQPGEARKAARLRFEDLTKRERQVMAEVLEGVPNKIIAADLGINQRTVENHRAAVMRKTGAASLPELVRLALLADVVGN
ncbi:chemotaxis protein CheB [Roseicyclus marinus]|uniref:chemotaxis protein CheB n=1 Tax=Roseicyclus marinus TaxID=2161673 RepID=UPI00240EA762|nr:chemotaxis protein CheB [Roseicyclus marinus]MDG3042795.1 CheR family methyltransferase [Roseicyclus marinus]